MKSPHPISQLYFNQQLSSNSSNPLLQHLCPVTYLIKLKSPAPHSEKSNTLFCGLTTTLLKLADNSNVYPTECAVCISVTGFLCHFLSQIRLIWVRKL